MTRLCKELHVWKINVNSFEEKPLPDFFFSSDNDLKLTFPHKMLKPIQEDALEKYADRIIGIDVPSYEHFKFVRGSWLKHILRLQSLAVRDREYHWEGKYKHLSYLLYRNRESIQELFLNDIWPGKFLKVTCKFEKLTKLHIVFHPDTVWWSSVVPFMNNCPNLVDLKLHGIADLSTNETVITPHPKIKYLDLYKSCEMRRKKDAAYIRDIMMACKGSLENLKLRAFPEELKSIRKLDWYLPYVKTAEICTYAPLEIANAPLEKEYWIRHFNENVKIII